MANKTLKTRQKMAYRAPATPPAAARVKSPMQGEGGKRKRGVPPPQR